MNSGSGAISTALIQRVKAVQDENEELFKSLRQSETSRLGERVHILQRTVSRLENALQGPIRAPFPPPPHTESFSLYRVSCDSGIALVSDFWVFSSSAVLIVAAPSSITTKKSSARMCVLVGRRLGTIEKYSPRNALLAPTRPPATNGRHLGLEYTRDRDFLMWTMTLQFKMNLLFLHHPPIDGRARPGLHRHHLEGGHEMPPRTRRNFPPNLRHIIGLILKWTLTTGTIAGTPQCPDHRTIIRREIAPGSTEAAMEGTVIVCVTGSEKQVPRARRVGEVTIETLPAENISKGVLYLSRQTVPHRAMRIEAWRKEWVCEKCETYYILDIRTFTCICTKLAIIVLSLQSDVYSGTLPVPD